MAAISGIIFIVLMSQRTLKTRCGYAQNVNQPQERAQMRHSIRFLSRPTSPVTQGIRTVPTPSLHSKRSSRQSRKSVADVDEEYQLALKHADERTQLLEERQRMETEYLAKKHLARSNEHCSSRTSVASTEVRARTEHWVDTDVIIATDANCSVIERVERLHLQSNDTKQPTGSTRAEQRSSWHQALRQPQQSICRADPTNDSAPTLCNATSQISDTNKTPILPAATKATVHDYRWLGPQPTNSAENLSVSKIIPENQPTDAAPLRHGVTRLPTTNIQPQLDPNILGQVTITQPVTNDFSFSQQRSRQMQREPVNNMPMQHSTPTQAIKPGLTDAQFAARQVMNRDLPTFSGLPEEWAIFISSYENSTLSCGFSNTENLIRLQRCLKGRALESVSCRLLLPSSVPGIIDTLRLLYGRPELILYDIIEKIRTEAVPRADDLDAIIRYSLMVQNLVSVMEASNMTSHLSNPFLLQELVGRLLSQLKLQWAMHAQSNDSDLSTLSTWLTKIALAASTVIFIINNRQAIRSTRSENKVPTECS